MMVQKDELTYFPGSPPGKAFSYPIYSEIKIFPIVFFIYDKRLNDLLIILPIAERKKNKLVTNWTGYNVVKTKWLTQFFENLE